MQHPAIIGKRGRGKFNVGGLFIFAAIFFPQKNFTNENKEGLWNKI
jgi:hypothetical protein